MADRMIRLKITEESWQRLRAAAAAQQRSRHQIATEAFLRLSLSQKKSTPKRTGPKPMSRCLPDSAVFLIRDLALAGRTYRSLADQFGVSLATIQRAINKNNGYKSARLRGPSLQPLEAVESIRGDRQRGLSYGQLGLKYKLSKATIYKICNRQGGYAFR